MRLWVYAVRRSLQVVPVVLGVLTILFLLLSALPTSLRLVEATGGSVGRYSPTVPCSTPGGPANGTCRNAAYDQLVHQLGLDQPAYVQWAIFMKDSLTLHWGTVDIHSAAADQIPVTTSVPVATVIGWYLPYSLELIGLAVALVLGVAVPLYGRATLYPRRLADRADRLWALVGLAVPGFLLTILGLSVVGFLGGGATPICGGQLTRFFDWYGSWPPIPQCVPRPSWIGGHFETFPTGFPTLDAALSGSWYLAAESVRRMVVPALIIAFGAVAAVLTRTRRLRSGGSEPDFVRTARAEGVDESTIARRTMGRNALAATLSVLGPVIAGVAGSLPIVEYIFDLKGVGSVLAGSIQSTPDFGLLFGATLALTLVVAVANVLVDVARAYLDPRARLL